MDIEQLPVVTRFPIQLFKHEWMFTLCATSDAQTYRNLRVLGTTQPRYLSIHVAHWAGDKDEFPLANTKMTTLHELAHAIDKEIYDLRDSECYPSVITELATAIYDRHALTSKFVQALIEFDARTGASK